MKNISMFIRGAIGIKKGLGRDEIEFDLRDKVGLVALAGPNGKGKTTFLELMSLYRTLASRKGSLKHHFCLRDSRVEHKFIYDGDEYHLIWKIDSGSDRSEAFIIVNGESVVNGKNTEYDKYINEKFGSQILFYNSVFCAQGSGNLSTMTTGKIKELFVEFLRIGRLAEYEKQCKKGVAYCQKKLDILAGKIETHKSELEKLHGIDDDIRASDELIKTKESALSEINSKILLVDESVNSLSAKAKDQESYISKKKDLESELEALEQDRQRVRTKIDSESDTFMEKKARLDSEMESVNAILAGREKIFRASSRIANLEKWEKYFSDCFECSIEEQARFTKDIKGIESRKEDEIQKIADLEGDLILNGLQTTLNYFQNRKSYFDTEHSSLNNRLKSAQNDFALMQAKQNTATCREKISLAIDPDCISTTCPALEMVAKAKRDLPGLEKIEADIKAKNDILIKEIETNIKLCDANLLDTEHKIDLISKDHKAYSIDINMEIEHCKQEVSVLDDARKILFSNYLVVDDFKGYYKSRLAGTRTLISDLKELSSKKSQIEVAEERRLSIEAQINQLESDHSSRVTDHDSALQDLSKNILMKKDEVSKADKNIDPDIDIKVNEANAKKTSAASERDRISEDLDAWRGKVAVLRNDKARAEQLTEDIAVKRSDETTLKKELSEWEYLRLACSKTGLQALEIDGAAPLITAEANTLLEKAFGLESQIKIITQDPESGKEVFWIRVIREDGSEDDFANLSGGQKVWISEALSKGMTLVSKKKSGRNFDTLYADENDGALDSEKAVDFMNMKRAMLATGDFETFFFISHNPDVVAMADHVIDFGELYDHNAVVMDQQNLNRIN